MTTEYKKPLPTPSPESKRYWEGCKNHELWLPYCKICQKPYFYPREFCPTSTPTARAASSAVRVPSGKSRTSISMPARAAASMKREWLVDTVMD